MISHAAIKLLFNPLQASAARLDCRPGSRIDSCADSLTADQILSDQSSRSQLVGKLSLA